MPSQNGELAAAVALAGEAGGEGADGQPGHQIADDTGQPQLASDEAAQKGQDDGHGDGGQQSEVLMH